MSKDYSNAKLLTVQQARERYQLSRATLMKIAEEAAAVRRFGRAIRLDIQLLDKAIETNC